LLALTAATPSAQSPDPAQPRLVAPPATAVLVDVVVRDGHGVLITDLDTEAVEVLEDGVRQQIVLFEAPRGRGAPAATTDPGTPASRPGSATPTGAPNLVALVFEELGPEARAAAYKAARVYLAEQKGSDEFVGVFAIDQALHTLVPYTRNIRTVERGVRTAAMRPGCPLYFEGDVAPAAFGEECTKARNGRLRAVATLDAVTAVIDALHLVPGRKSVLFFSEGIRLESESEAMMAPGLKGDGPPYGLIFTIGDPDAGQVLILEKAG